MDKPFSAGGPTTLVGTTAVQIPPGVGQSFRLRNPSASTAVYITWGQASTVTCTAPIAGTSQLNTLGLSPSAVEKITMSAQAQWWIASTTAGVEVTQGDGV